MKAISSAFNGRREAIYLALAAAEISWLAPLFLAVSGSTGHRPSLGLWLALLLVLLGFFYVYRALAWFFLSLRLVQGLLVLVLLLSIGLAFRFHVYADLGLQGLDWFVEPFRRLSQISSSITSELITIFALLYLWARGIHLARRGITADAVGFSFRAGVVILVWGALAIYLFTDADASAFIAPFFFFGLVAVALSRVEEVSRMPGSRRAPGTSFWIGSTVGAVVLVVLLSSLVALFFAGGSLERVLRFLSPVLVVVQLLFVGLALLIFGLLELLFTVLGVNLSWIQNWIREMMAVFQPGQMQPALPRPEESPMPKILGTVQAGTILAIVVVLVALVLLFTWWRISRERNGGVDEWRESLLSASVLAQGLKNMLRSGRDRLSQMAGLVDRFGLGAQLLSAISIQRIYANLVRLATKAGYPRVKAQTPYEYLVVLAQAWPDHQTDLTVITDAYINAHYGQVPDTREELDRIRACWERVRSEAPSK